MALEALIFDLDGTLVDTAPDLMAATNHVLNLAGRPNISEEQLRQFVGQGAMNLIKRGLAATGGMLDEAEIKRLHDKFLAFYGDNLAVHSQVFPGVVKFLEEAKIRGLKLGVCTNKVEGLSNKLLNGIGLAKYFSAVVGGDTLPIMKPDVAPYNEVARRLGVAPQRTLMFGDSETDIRTAQNVGVPVIAVSFGYTHAHVSNFAPTYVIDHYDEAWPLVKAYG
jgi:phosphoglycolate phosphatase